MITTERLTLRPPTIADAHAIFSAYGSDKEATRFMSWPTHTSLADTEGFLAYVAAEETERVFLILYGETLIGSTGLSYEAPHTAMTGYILARPFWGQGFATEALRAVVDYAFSAPSFYRLYADCHTSNVASERVLAKCGFAREGTLRRHTVFPNLSQLAPQDIALWARIRQ